MSFFKSEKLKIIWNFAITSTIYRIIMSLYQKKYTLSISKDYHAIVLKNKYFLQHKRSKSVKHVIVSKKIYFV